MSQDVNITIQDGGLGILPPSSDDIHAVIGCSSSGTALQVTSTTKISDLVSSFGYGPAVEAAAFAIQASGAQVLFVKVASTTPGASGAVSHSGAGTSVVTTTGAPYDAYRVKIVFLTAGTIGVAGITFKYSLDGGENYSATIALGTANSYVIPNTGMTVAFAAGTILADQVESWTTTEPAWTIADVQSAIAALKASVYQFRFIHLVGAVTAGNVATLDTEMTGCATAFRYTGLLCHARDFEAEDVTEAAWISSIQTAFASTSSKRVSVAAGYYQVTSPIGGWQYRRPLSFPVAARLVAKAIQIDAGRVKDGSLAGVSSSTTDGMIYHDERVNPGLDASRFLSARTLIGRPGWFVMNPNMMAPAGSDFIWWQYRSVIDKACTITRDVLLNFLSAEVRLNPATGYILEKDAQDIESRLRSAFRDSLVAPGAVSSVSATVSRVDNIISTRTINVTVRVVPLGYLKDIEVDLGFTNPALVIA